MNKSLITLFAVLVLPFCLWAQPEPTEPEEPAVTEVQEEEPAAEGKAYVHQTFPNVWIVNTASTETVQKKSMTFRIHHRLGNIRGGLQEFFGIDGPASIWLGLDYGITDNLTVGLGRSSFGKILDGYVKYRVLRQEVDGGMPVSVAVYGKGNMTLLPNNPVDDRFGSIANRMSYLTQVIVARKFGESVALQVAPTFVHHNLTQATGFANSQFGLTAAARVRVSKRIGFSAEYGQILSGHLPDAAQDDFHPSIGLSLDMMTGGHVFQIVLTNSFDINETMAVPYSRNDFFAGDLHIGFNIMRSFWL